MKLYFSILIVLSFVAASFVGGDEGPATEWFDCKISEACKTFDKCMNVTIADGIIREVCLMKDGSDDMLSGHIAGDNNSVVSVTRSNATSDYMISNIEFAIAWQFNEDTNASTKVDIGHDNMADDIDILDGKMIIENNSEHAATTTGPIGPTNCTDLDDDCFFQQHNCDFMNTKQRCQKTCQEC